MAHTGSAVLARKLRLGQGDLGDRPRSFLRVLRLGFARAAGDRLNLPLTVIGARQADRAQADIFEILDDDWLLLMFSRADGIAAACMDVNCVSAIVQTQTIGEVTADPPTARAFTDTDAAMTAPLVEDVLIRAIDSVDTADQSALSDYEFASRAADKRSLMLELIAETYCVFDLTVELAGGIRQGHIAVLLPQAPPSEETEAECKVHTGPSLEQSSGVVRAELNAVLCRMTLPLAQLSDFEVGGLLPLTGARLNQTQILTIERTRAAQGRLGQSGGMRAVRLNETTPRAVLTGQDPTEFIESKPAASTSDLAEIGADNLVEPYDTSAPSQGIEPIDNDLSLVPPDQMAAEISQLAGLDSTEDGLD